MIRTHFAPFGYQHTKRSLSLWNRFSPNKQRWYATASASSANSKPSKALITVREALNQAMREEMDRDRKVFLLGEEVGKYNGAYKVTAGLFDHFGGPPRVFDTPISEQGFTGMAIGAAWAGLRPIVEFMSMSFSFQALDQIVNSCAKGRYMSGGQLQCPIVFRGPNGIASGVGAQHSHCLSALYASIPGLRVGAPYSAHDAYTMLKGAVRHNEPVVFLENELLYGQRFTRDEAFSNMDDLPSISGKVEREGSDVTLVSFSRGVGICLEAAAALREEYGIDAEVINLRWLRPLDVSLIESSLRKTHRLVVVEENWPSCSVGSEIVARVCEGKGFDYLDAPIRRVGCVEVPVPYAEALEKAMRPQIDDVVLSCCKACDNFPKQT